jgi:hypothetical protein
LEVYPGDGEGAGLSFATTLTLIVVPTLYVALMRLVRRGDRKAVAV